MAKLLQAQQTNQIEAEELVVFDGGEIVVMEGNVAAMFTEVGVDLVLARAKEWAASLEYDLSTKKSRDKIASYKGQVSSATAEIEKRGKKYELPLKQQYETVQKQRIRLVKALNELRDQVREPLTAWEEGENARTAARESRIAEIAALKNVAFGERSDYIRGRLANLDELIQYDWKADFEAKANAAHGVSLQILTGAYHAQKRNEEQEAENAKLKAEKAEADRKEKERLDAEAKEKQAAALEQKRKDDETAREIQAAKDRADKAEAETKEAKEAAKQAIIDAENRAKQDKIDAERKEAARDAEDGRKKKEQADAADAEKQRLQKIEDNKRDEEERRKADDAHRAKVEAEIAEALQGYGFDTDTARIFVEAIKSGKIPHVAINY